MFIISVFDLTTGHEVCHKETNDFQTALASYLNAVDFWRDAEDSDLPPFDAMLWISNGHIIYGFGE